MKYLCGLMLAGLVTLTMANDNVSVKVIALFNDKAMLSINGDRAKIMRSGETRNGVKLVSADTASAIIEVNGAQETLTLNGTVVLSQSLGAAVPDGNKNSIQIWADDFGFFRADGSVNGKKLNFLVDTGANIVVISSQQADRLGIDYRSGIRGQANTASGVAQMYVIQADEISFGQIRLRGIETGIILGSHPQTPLLGMSFLNRLEMNREGNMMILKKRF